MRREIVRKDPAMSCEVSEREEKRSRMHNRVTGKTKDEKTPARVSSRLQFAAFKIDGYIIYANDDIFI